MSSARCECCEELNMWSLLADEFEHVCGVCVEEGLVELCLYTGQWHVIAECGCGKTGPVNYDGGRYFCGGSERCIP